MCEREQTEPGYGGMINTKGCEKKHGEVGTLVKTMKSPQGYGRSGNLEWARSKRQYRTRRERKESEKKMRNMYRKRGDKKIKRGEKCERT